MIGKLSPSSDRGLVFDLVPTPPNDAGEPACSIVDSGRDEKKKGSKGKSQTDSSSLFIDKDWVAEHARQVYLEFSSDLSKSFEMKLDLMRCIPIPALSFS